MKKVKNIHIFIAALFISAAIMGAGTQYETRVWLCEFSGRQICYKLSPPPENYSAIECSTLRQRTGIECYQF